jgi:tetratricopeptide (TPR) repeat protein
VYDPTVHRTAVITVALTALVAGVSLGWVDVREEREFRLLIAEGDRAAAGDRQVEAIEAFSGAIALKPDSMLAYLKRGETYRRRGDLDAALRDLSQATSLDPTAPQPIERLGDVNAAVGQYARAAGFYERYLALDDRAAPVLYKLGLAHYRAGRLADAVEPLRKAIAIDGRLVEAHYALGMTHRAAGAHDEAVAALLRALELDPTFAAGREELADLLTDIGRRRDGLEQLEALAALQPARAERLVSVGLAYSRLQRHEAAILTLNRAAERHPDSRLVRVALGEAWLAMAESGTDVDTVATHRAIEMLAPVTREPNPSSHTLMLYGRAQLMTGNAAAAEQTLQQAIARLPVSPDAFRYLADAATRLGHHAIAQQAEASLARF